MTRVSLGTYRTIVPIKKVWIAGEHDPVPLRGARRRIVVQAPSREKQLYINTHSGEIDAGMELAAPLNPELPSVAVAGGWAASRPAVACVKTSSSRLPCLAPRAQPGEMLSCRDRRR
jgi:hypothetical protein